MAQTKKSIIIIGASGHAKVIIDIIEQRNMYKIVGLVDSFKTTGSDLLGYKILGTEHDVPYLLKTHDISGGIIAIGDNWKRFKMFEKILDQSTQFKFISAIHPNAVIGKNVFIDDGTVVVAGAIINCDTKIGKHCIINTNTSVGHECLINDFSSMAPGVTIGGNVVLEKYTAISLGASIIGNIKIGEHTVIGAGALVLKNMEAYKVAYGVPAKIIRNRSEGDSYL